jgi:hypothetical protein
VPGAFFEHLSASFALISTVHLADHLPQVIVGNGETWQHRFCVLTKDVIYFSCLVPSGSKAAEVPQGSLFTLEELK